MAQVTRSLVVQADAGAVWETLADFAAVERYSPLVAKCELEGPDGVGQLRRLTLTTGSITVSRLSAIDPEARTLTYQILETKLPLADYSSTMSVEDVSGGGCRITWSSGFEPSGASEAEASAFLTEQLDAGLEELRALHEKS